MLEVRNLKKIYKTKGGVQVRALDDISIRFPETGMVFLLGKSGSGKSTLLNVSGGLDRPDDGEIIVKGKSSKDFSQSDFDSYRNTYIGFVFQEYNILNEFNVETNIGLALELQGRKRDKKLVNDILKQVDLEGLGKRKPNTLSGGQKQRIAIARALIKEPEIIMADEPTGALDSNTGKQVLDTLKKLSKNKLVIVVSHDRDFAEYYGDRIIELKDGKVLSDVSKDLAKPTEISKNIIKIGEDTIQIKDFSSVSDDEMKKILSSLKEKKGEVIISTGERNLENYKKAARINDEGHQEYFKDTDLKKVDIKDYDGSKTKFIKSKLPMKHAMKMGSSNLKIKPFRLMFTMFLCVIAFTLFGILSTLMFYNPAFTYSDSLKKSDFTALVSQKNYKTNVKNYRVSKDGETVVEDDYENVESTNISKEDLKLLNENSYGMDFAGVYKGYFTYLDFLANKPDRHFYNLSGFYGLCDCGEEYLKRNGFSVLAGHYPINEDEVAISSYAYTVFEHCGYLDVTSDSVTKITSYNDLIGKKIRYSMTNYDTGLHLTINLTISGILDLGNEYKAERYNVLQLDDSSEISPIEYEQIKNDFEDVFNSSYYGLAYVASDFYDCYQPYLHSYRGGQYYIPETYIYGKKYLNGSLYENYLWDKEIGQSSLKDYFPFMEWDSLTALTSSSFTENPNNFFCVDVEGKQVTDLTNMKKDDVYESGSYWFLFDVVRPVVHKEVPVNGKYDELNPHYYIDDKEDLIKAILRYEIEYADDSEIYTLRLRYDFNKLIKGLGDFTINDVKVIIDAYNKIKAEYPDDSDFRDLTYKCAVTDYDKSITELTLRGYVFCSKSTLCHFECVLSDQWIKEMTLPIGYDDTYDWITKTTTKYRVDSTAQYNRCIAKSDMSMEQLKFLLKEYNDDSYYTIDNSIFEMVASLTSVIQQLETIFLISGSVMAIFAGLMLLNFISTSIATKQKEIGILRAVGARGADVFKIYFSEAGVIGTICFLISSIVAAILCVILNNEVSAGLSIILFEYNVFNILFILGVAIVVSFLGTIFPVIKASRRPPVESIRAL